MFFGFGKRKQRIRPLDDGRVAEVVREESDELSSASSKAKLMVGLFVKFLDGLEKRAIEESTAKRESLGRFGRMRRHWLAEGVRDGVFLGASGAAAFASGGLSYAGHAGLALWARDRVFGVGRRVVFGRKTALVDEMERAASSAEGKDYNFRRMWRIGKKMTKKWARKASRVKESGDEARERITEMFNGAVDGLVRRSGSRVNSFFRDAVGFAEGLALSVGTGALFKRWF